MSSTQLPLNSPAKRILVLSYSQTGQLTQITRRIIEPLQHDPLITVHIETLRPLHHYPFPWKFFSFLDAFP